MSNKEQFQASADELASIIQKWKEENDLLYEAETSEEENSSDETTMDMDHLLTDLTQAEKSQQSDVHDTYAYSKYCVKEEIVFGVSEPDESTIKIGNESTPAAYGLKIVDVYSLATSSQMKSQPNISTVSALVDFKNVSDTAQAYSTSSTVITSLVKEENSQENSNINDPPSANTRNNETVESPSPENDSSVFERYIPPGAQISKTRRSNRLIASSIKKKIGLNEAEAKEPRSSCVDVQEMSVSSGDQDENGVAIINSNAPLVKPELAKTDGTAQPQKSKKGSRFPKRSVVELKKWIQEHPGDLYPDFEEKMTLVEDTGLTVPQITKWFDRFRQKEKLYSRIEMRQKF